MERLIIVIPQIPPSLNHYRKQRVVAGRVSWYMGDRAKVWFAVFQAIVNGRTLPGERYALEYRVFAGTRRLFDIDNAAKIVGDSLQKCGVIKDDAQISEIHGYREYDKINPRTEIILRTMDRSEL